MLAGPIARATLQTSVVLGVRLVAQAGTLWLVARLLGPTAFGQFAGMAALAVLFGTVATLGLNIQLLGHTARAPDRASALLGPALRTTLQAGSVLLLVFVLLVPRLLPQAAQVAWVPAAIGLTEILLHPLISLPSALRQAHGRIAHSQWLITLPYVLRVAVAAAVTLSGTAQPLPCYALAYPLPALVMLLLVLRPWWTGSQPPSLRHPTARSDLRSALPFAALSLTALAPAELDKTLASRLLPGGEAGLYAASARAIGALTLPVVAMMLSALPRLFRAGQEHPQAIRRLLRWVLAATLGYSMAMALVLWWLAPLLDTLFGVAYRGLSVTVRLLVFAVPGMALRTAAGSALMALGQPWMRVSFELLGMALLPGLAVLLVPVWPTQGLPLAVVVTESAMALLGWLLLARTLQRAPAPA